jgi:hypothetical protein
MWRDGKGPFQFIMAFKQFVKWGLDFMKPIKLATKSTRNQDILVAIDYTTKWVKRKHYEKILLKASLNLFMKILLSILDV